MKHTPTKRKTARQEKFNERQRKFEAFYRALVKLEINVQLLALHLMRGKLEPTAENLALIVEVKKAQEKKGRKRNPSRADGNNSRRKEEIECH